MADEVITAKSRIITEPGRLSFPSLFKPEIKKDAKTGVETAWYCASLLLPKATTDLGKLRTLAEAVLSERWPDAGKRPKKLRSVLHDGDAETWDGYAGCWFIRTKSKMQPGIIDCRKQAITSESVLYPGCWVRLLIGAYAYDTEGNAGVTLSLYHVLKVKDDEPFGNRIDAVDAFAGFTTDAPDGSEDPKNYPAGDKGGDSDLPF